MAWYEENMRVVQTVLRENDLKDYDASYIVSYMEEVNANCLVINGGGVIDFFKHPLDMAKPNQFMGEDDFLEKITQAVKAAGKRILVRVDFRGVEHERYSQRPEWFSQYQDGRPKQHTYTTPYLYAPCYNSPYTSSHAVAFVQYIMDHYEIDGIWENSIGFDYGPCYCKNCREKYAKDIGSDLPLIPEGMDVGDALDSPAFANYRKWKEQQADLHLERLRQAVKAYGEEKVFCAEIFDMYKAEFTKFTGIGHQNAKKSFDFIVSCVFLSSGHDAIYPYDIISNASATIRLSKAIDPHKQALVVTGGNGNRWRYTADPHLETKLWLWEIASVGGGIWNCYFNGHSPQRAMDKRNAYSEKDAFTYLRENSGQISISAPVKDIAVFYSNLTRDRYSHETDKALDRFGIFHRGVERILLENHLQYGYVTDQDFSLESLAQVKTLILPNVAFLSDYQIEVIQTFVKAGGGLVASHETSLYDEEGNPRPDFGLKELLGVSYTGVLQETLNDTYQLIKEKDSPLLKGVFETEVLITSGKTLLVSKVNEAYRSVTTHVPTIPNQPPENAWRSNMATDYPIIVTGEYGKGRVVYFANQIEALAFVHGHEDYTETYKNAIDFAMGSQPYLLEAAAPRSVHINSIEDPQGNLVVSFVNTTGTSQRPLKEVVAVSQLSVKVNREIYWDQSRPLWAPGFGYDPETSTIKLEKLEDFASVYLPGRKG